MKKVITTVGTSLLEKLKIKTPKALKEATFSQWEKFEENISEVKEAIQRDISAHSNETLCAETQTLLKIKKTQPKIETYLICTDTILSVICADAIKPILEKEGIHVRFEHSPNHVITGLVVEGKKSSLIFSEVGFPNLIKAIREIEKNAPINNRPILNISGGYKALIPVMTIMGQLYDMEVNYVYEESEELIVLPKIPMDFDISFIEEYIPFLDEFYLSKDIKKTIEKFPAIIDKLKKSGLINGEKFPYQMTFSGQLIKAYSENESFYSSESTLSHIVEYKLFEFFSDTRNHYISKDNIAFKKPPIRSYPLRIGGVTKGEIDILLQSGSTNDPYIGIEVKGLGTVLGNIEKLQKQVLERQIYPVTQIRNGKKPHEYHYVIYQMLGGMNENSQFLKDQLSKLKIAVEREIGIGKFKSYLFTVEKFTGKEIYKFLLEKKVAPIHLKEIQI